MALRIDRLQALREKRGWSQRELAKQSGIGFTTLYQYEIGKSDPGSEALKKMADVLEVSADYLLGRTDYPHSNVGDGTFTEEENALVEVYRREGWTGVIKFGAEKLAR